MSVQSSSGSLEGPPSWSQLSTSPTPGSAAAARSLLNHTPPSGRPREGKRSPLCELRCPGLGGCPSLARSLYLLGRAAEIIKADFDPGPAPPAPNPEHVSNFGSVES
ncbi:hypothetical protein FD755_007159, partial [Muntiacus reevesi]